MTGGINLNTRIAQATKALADIDSELAWEMAGTAADAAGLIDPTPTSDLIGAGIAVRNGDFLGAGLSVASMIPYLGDAAAKPIKAGRTAKRLMALKQAKVVAEKKLADLRVLKKQEEAAEAAAKEAKIGKDAKKPADREKGAAQDEKAATKDAKNKDCEDCGNAGKAAKPTKDKPAQNSDKKPDSAGDDTKNKGDGREGGRCKLRPYQENFGHCPDGGTPHHVVPDHCFRPKGQKAPYSWGVSHADGLTICVSGPGKRSVPSGGTTSRGKGENLRSLFRRLAEHGQTHMIMDVAEAALGAVGDPKGTARLDAIEKAGARSVAKVTGCDKEYLARQLREYHQSKGLPPDTVVRADPLGKGTNPDPTKLGPRGNRGHTGIE